jgi:hypothetical protein
MSDGRYFLLVLGIALLLISAGVETRAYLKNEYRTGWDLVGACTTYTALTVVIIWIGVT